MLSSSPVFAAPPPRLNVEDDATVAMARERFKEGVGFFDQKQYDKARAAFLQAYALKKHPAVLLNLAQSELRSGHEADAANHFSTYLRDAKEASEAEKQTADAGLTAAKAVVAEVEITVDERGAEVYVDGGLIGNSPLPGSIYLTPGPHSLEARRDGRLASTQISAIAAKHLDAELKFAPRPLAPTAPLANPDAAPDAAPGPGREPFFKWLTSSPVGIVGMSLTGVGLIGGVGFALASKKDYSNADSVAAQITQAAKDNSHNPDPNTAGLCVDPSAWLTAAHYDMASGTTAERAAKYTYACSQYQKHVNDGDSKKTIATVGFVVAGVAAVGTVIYYFADPNAKEGPESARAKSRRIALVPVLSPGERGLSLIGNF